MSKTVYVLFSWTDIFSLTVANMYAALYGGQPTVQGIKLLQDLKLGQYIKIPPRVNFIIQILGCIVGAILNYVMMLSVIDSQRDALLSIAGTRLWSGQNAQSYNSNVRLSSLNISRIKSVD